MYLNTFENTFTFPKNKKITCLKKLGEYNRDNAKMVINFMLLLKRSLHYQYQLFIKEKKYDCRIDKE